MTDWTKKLYINNYIYVYICIYILYPFLIISVSSKQKVLLGQFYCSVPSDQAQHEAERVALSEAVGSKCD